MKASAGRLCELCNAQASVFCSSDSAFLCWNCDNKVHRANFLVARHFRRTICSKCKSFTGNRVSGVSFQPSFAVCPSCSPANSSATNDDDDDHYLDFLSSSSNSDCVSSTLSSSCATTTQKRSDCGCRKIDCCSSSGEVTSGKSQHRRSASHVDLKAEAILVNWCAKLGLEGDRAVLIARNALLSICWDQTRSVLPLRVCLVASLWFASRSFSTLQLLKRLEDISGVPSKIIAAAGSKLERGLKFAAKARRKQSSRSHQPQEGWAES